MSKSNYEIWAEREQPKKLMKTTTLNDAVVLLKRFSIILNDDLIQGMKILIENLYGIQEGELDRLLDGCEHWIV